MVTPPEKAKDEATYVEIYFEKGIAKKVDGIELRTNRYRYNIK